MPLSYAQANPKPSPVLALDIQELVPLSQTPDETPMLEALHAANVIEAAKEAVATAEAVKQAQIASEQAPVPTPTPTPVVGAIGNDYTFGQCTYFVASKVGVPSDMGNATNWEAGLLTAGWHYGLQAGSIGVSHAGVDGHVVYVDSVIAGVPTISEMNAVGFDVVDTRLAGSSEFIWLAP